MWVCVMALVGSLEFHSNPSGRTHFYLQLDPDLDEFDNQLDKLVPLIPYKKNPTGEIWLV